MLSRISPRTRLLAIILIVVFCLLFASAVCKTFVEDIAEESREEENYENLFKRLTEFHCTMLGVDGASGENGDRWRQALGLAALCVGE